MATTSNSTATGPASAGLFARRSSGLVREIGLRQSLGIGLGILLLLALYSYASISLQLFPNGDYYIPILIGALIALPLAYAYIQLVGTFPRSGGEYIYASRVFAPIVGAAVGGAVFVAVCLNSANTVIQIDQFYVPFMFTTLGHALGIHALVTFGNSTLAGKLAWLIVGLVVIAVFAIVSMRPIAGITRWIFWLFIAGLIAHFLMAALLLLITRNGFINSFNAASGSGAYQSIMSTAHSDGFQTGVKAGDVVALIPVAALLFVGFTFGNYAAGEIKRPLTTYKIAVLAALGIGVAALLLGWAAMRHAAGLPFMQSSASLQANDPTAYSKLTPIPASQGGLAYAVVASHDPVTKVIVALGTVAGWLANGLAYFMLASRVVFALSFDRLLPAKMADVQTRTHAPVYAVALVALGVLAFTVVGNETGFLSLFRNLILVIYAIFVVGCLCAAALPYRRPELFAASPKVFRGRVLGVPAVTVVAALAAVLFAAVDVILASKSAYSGGYSLSSIITLAVVATFGLLLYVGSRLGLKARGIDLRLAMRELPPE